MTNCEQPATPPSPGSTPPPYGTPDRSRFRRAKIQDEMPGISLPRRRRVGKVAASIAGVTLFSASGLIWASQGQESPASFCADAEGEFLSPSHGQVVDGNEGILVEIQTNNLPAGCGVSTLDQSPNGGYYRVTEGLESLLPGDRVTIPDQPIGSRGEVNARYSIVAVVGDAACATSITAMNWDTPYQSLPGGCRVLDNEDIIVTRP